MVSEGVVQKVVDDREWKDLRIIRGIESWVGGEQDECVDDETVTALLLLLPLRNMLEYAGPSSSRLMGICWRGGTSRG